MAVARALGRLLEVEDRRGVPGRPAEQGSALMRCSREYRRLHELADHGERKLPLELAGAGQERPDPGARCRLDGGAKQTGLADPGRSGHDGPGAIATDRSRGQGVERGQLELALEERPGGSRAGPGEGRASAHDQQDAGPGGSSVGVAGEKDQGRSGTRSRARADTMPPASNAWKEAPMTTTETGSTNGAAASDLDAAKAICLRSFEVMRDGTLEDFEEIIHADAYNREQVDEPPESRGRGPATFYATALWLRDAFAELDFDIHEVVAEGEIVVVHNTMSGRHVKTFLDYDEHAGVSEAFPPTRRRFATRQTHWFRVRDGKVIEHWADRDDMGMALQLGWVPPTPLYMLRMVIAKRRARRASGR